VNFTVNNPAPSISSFSPPSATAGAAAQTLTINGTNFLSTSTVTYNNVAHAATFVSATELTIPLTANDQLTAGSYPVVVTNPGPGGGTSKSVNFMVNPASTESVSFTSPSNPASVTVGQSLPIKASVTGATADLTLTVNGVEGGNSTFGTIAGAYPSYTYTAPPAIPGGNNPVTIEATQAGTSQSASLTVTIEPSTTIPTAVTITNGDATGINFSLSSNSSLTLGLADVGSCVTTGENTSCGASVTGIQVSKSGAATGSCPATTTPATCTVWLLGQGLTDNSGIVVSGLSLSVTYGGTTPDVTVTGSSVVGMTPSDGLTQITFQVQVSSTAQLGLRNLVVKLPDGETQAYVGAIQIVN
jgi:hypothetical protein